MLKLHLAGLGGSKVTGDVTELAILNSHIVSEIDSEDIVSFKFRNTTYIISNIHTGQYIE